MTATRIRIKVSPGASRDAVIGWLGDALKVSVTAPPERGKANAAIISLIARALGLSASRVTVVSGETSARKTIEISGLSLQEIREKLDRQ